MADPSAQRGQPRAAHCTVDGGVKNLNTWAKFAPVSPYQKQGPKPRPKEVFYGPWNDAGLEIARNTCVSVKGPCQITDTGGIDVNQLRLVSSSASAAQSGDSLAAAVRIGSIMSPMGLDHPENRVYSAVLTSNGSPLQDRKVALSFGSFARVPLAARALADGPYDITDSASSLSVRTAAS